MVLPSSRLQNLTIHARLNSCFANSLEKSDLKSVKTRARVIEAFLGRFGVFYIYTDMDEELGTKGKQ